VKGNIINVMNGLAMSGVTVQVWRGRRLVRNVQVSRSGSYFTRLDPGQYKITCSMRGFMTFRRTITVFSARTLTSRLFMSPTMATGQIRLVLTWNKRISDLDFHLSTPTGCNVGWRNKNCNQAGNKASLDVDDVNGEGPETITIEKLHAGTYKLWVHRYSDGNMLRSAATVRVIFPSGAMRVYRVGTDGQMTAPDTWTVLTIDGASGNIFGPVMGGTKWTTVPGTPAVFSSISTSQSGLNVWGVSNGAVYRRNGIIDANKMGTSWSVIQGPAPGAAGVAASDLGVWVWTSAGAIFARTDVTPASPVGSSWLAVPKPAGDLKSVSFDGANAVATTTDGRLWWRAGVTASNPKGSRWFQVPGRTTWVGIYSTSLWVTRNGRIYRRSGMASAPPAGSGWTRVPGAGQRLSVSNGVVWLTNRHGRVFYRKGITSRNPTGRSWEPLPGASRLVKMVSAGNGVVWGLDKAGSSPIFREGVARTGQ